MLVARVVHHEVEDDLHPALVAGGDEPVEVGLGPEQRVDRGVVRHVVAEVAAGRRVDRRQPDRVDREAVRPEVIEVVEDPGQVAGPVPVVVARSSAGRSGRRRRRASRRRRQGWRRGGSAAAGRSSAEQSGRGRASTVKPGRRSAVAARALLYSAAMTTRDRAPSDRPIRIGIAGLGAVAQAVHLPLLARLADTFEIAALADLSPDLLATLGERYRVPPAARFGSVEALLDGAAIDGLLVLTSGSHGAVALAALDRGLAVLCEKPLAYTLAEADALAASPERRTGSCSAT